jgi:hypothetical protein
MIGWVILWALVLGFALSGVVQAVVTKGEMSRPPTVLLASALGAASSSYSYAAGGRQDRIHEGGSFNAGGREKRPIDAASRRALCADGVVARINV